jgi:5-oxoprolinase (ATP-hydrolysing)
METVFIHPFAGVLSPTGMGLADQSAIREAAVEAPLTPEAMEELRARSPSWRRPGAPSSAPGRGRRALRRARLHLRYQGTDSFLPVPFGAP